MNVERTIRRWTPTGFARTILIAVGLGLAVGALIQLYLQAIELSHAFFHDLNTRLHPILSGGAVILTLAAAGALVGLILDRFVGEERLHGVASVMQAVALTGGRLPYKKMPFKAVASVISLGAGAAVGPEDPSVQIGANVGSWFGVRLGGDEETTEMLVASGVAGAVAAAFGAPIAGIFFALEVVLNGAFNMWMLGAAVVSAVTASTFMRTVSPHVEMGPFDYALNTPLEVTFFVPLGILLALASIVYLRLVNGQHHFWHHLRLSRPLKTALAGALVGGIGVLLPEILGTGREVMNGVLGGELVYAPLLLLALGLGKMIANPISVGGGFAGGVFAPSLFIGIMGGMFYGQVLQGLGVGISAPAAYGIAGMAAMLAGVVRSPITAILIVFELTSDYPLILPIMLTTLVCAMIVERITPGIYKSGLLRAGIRLPEGRELDLMQGVTVAEAMLKPAPTIQADAPLRDLRDALRNERTQSLCVVDNTGELCGVVTLSDLQRAFDANPSGELTVGEICSRKVITVSPADTLWMAIKKMSRNDVGRLPVVDPATDELIGFIGRHGIMRAYNIAIARKLEDQHVAERVRLNMLTGAHVFEFGVEAGSALDGVLIRDVAWLPESVVASIQREGRLLVPHGNTRIRVGDRLTMVAAPSAEAALRALGRAPVSPPSSGDRPTLPA